MYNVIVNTCEMNLKHNHLTHIPSGHWAFRSYILANNFIKKIRMKNVVIDCVKYCNCMDIAIL